MKPVKNLTGSQVLLLAKVYMQNAEGPKLLHNSLGAGAYVGDNVTYRSLKDQGYLVGTLAGSNVWVTSGAAESMGLPWTPYSMSRAELATLDQALQRDDRTIRITTTDLYDTLPGAHVQRFSYLGLMSAERLSPGYWGLTIRAERLADIKTILIAHRVPIIDAYRLGDDPTKIGVVVMPE